LLPSFRRSQSKSADGNCRYRPVVDAGAEALVVYQETYDRETYAEMHTSGPKRNFNWRLDCPERGYEAGFRRIGIGALFGLAPWRHEAVALAAHVEYLLKRCWQAQISVSCRGCARPRADSNRRSR
jgi:2-iminoacetate synthase